MIAKNEIIFKVVVHPGVYDLPIVDSHFRSFIVACV